MLFLKISFENLKRPFFLEFLIAIIARFKSFPPSHNWPKIYFSNTSVNNLFKSFVLYNYGLLSILSFLTSHEY